MGGLLEDRVNVAELVKHPANALPDQQATVVIWDGEERDTWLMVTGIERRIARKNPDAAGPGDEPAIEIVSPNTEWPYSVADPIVTNQVEYHPFLGQQAVRRCRHHHQGTSSRRGRSRARCRTMRETSRQSAPSASASRRRM